ncbi:MAG: hypothetical protein V3V05_05855, partial [Pontiella sp.]
HIDERFVALLGHHRLFFARLHSEARHGDAGITQFNLQGASGDLARQVEATAAPPISGTTKFLRLSVHSWHPPKMPPWIP